MFNITNILRNICALTPVFGSFGLKTALVSKWCTNSAQPNLENLIEVARCLEANVNELLRM